MADSRATRAVIDDLPLVAQISGLRLDDIADYTLLVEDVTGRVRTVTSKCCVAHAYAVTLAVCADWSADQGTAHQHS